MDAAGYSAGGKRERKGKGKGKGDAAAGKSSGSGELAKYLTTMLERLSPEGFSASARELKENIMPSIAESIQRLSEGAPDEDRKALTAVLVDKHVLPSYDADVDALRSALSDCLALANSRGAGGQEYGADGKNGKDKKGHVRGAKGYEGHIPEAGGKGGAKGHRRSKGGAKSAGGAGLAPPRDAAGRLSSLKVSFCPDPQSVGERFTGTYERSQPCHFGSLNAGDNAFNVGGATINMQFRKDLSQAGQDADKYKALHERLFRTAVPAQLTAASPEVLKGDPNVSAAYVRVLHVSQNVGTVFIDIFKEDRRPFDAKNVAMVYTVGCQRRDCGSDEEFLNTVRAIACNVSSACSEYNALAASPSLEKVRICLISGGAFAGKVPKGHVAEAIILGLLEGSSDAHSPEFEFSYDGDEFQAAFKRLSST
mmetsp:Transcript_129706/g.225329  ORF Transcript_129706/g.225329 Transcript_129706/m.225329 type:complete len:424 (-) Transcript_129706:149-1420(-)